MRGLFPAALVVLVAALGCERLRSKAQSDAAPAARSTEEVLGSVLPGVVLLTARRPDGSLGFGAGVIVDDDGLVLTNLHVVADALELGALTYDPTRVSYIPQDGGLARYLFENDGAVLGARLVRGDPTLDLALVKIATSTRGRALSLRGEPARQGEHVMAVGHPGETVWSFTSGVVSSLHQGMIQTDAAINRGNSGGPLVDVDGLVVGINTSKLLGDIHGVGFARPGAMLAPFVKGRDAESVVDRSTPESAVKTCARALESASESSLECIDYDAAWSMTQDKLERKKRRMKLDDAAKADFDARLGLVNKDEFVAVSKRVQLATLRGEDAAEAARELDRRVESMPMLDGAAPSYEKSLRRNASARSMRAALDGPDGGAAQYTRDSDARVLERTGLKIDRKNPRSTLDTLKMGIRVERTHAVDDAHAWVAVAGRNLDATEWRQSFYLVKHDDGWRQVSMPPPAAEATRPRDFPNTSTDYEVDIERMIGLEISLFRPARQDGGAAPRKKKR